MSFAAPLALLGAALLALPLWAHLKKEVDLPRLALPTAHLLETSEADADHRSRLQDWLWLLARLLMVVLLVLAAAAPFVRLPVSYGDGSHRSVCIVIDDSMSMMRKDETGTRLLDTAVARAQEIIDALPEESEVCVVASGRPARVVAPRSSAFADVRSALESIAVESFRGGDSEHAAQWVERELADARWEVRAAVILSDETQSADWPAWSKLDPSIEVTYEALTASNKNFTLGAVDATTTSEDKTMVDLTTEVLGSVDGPVSVEIKQGTETSRETVQLQDGRAKLRTQVRAGNEPIQLSVQSEDALTQDDTLVILPPGHGRLQVLSISDNPDDMLFVESAFTRARWSSRVAFRRVDPHRVRSADLEGVSLLIADDPALITLSKESINAFVREGGNLWIGIERRESVQAMRDLLENVLPARVGQVVKEDPALKVEVTVPGTERRAAGHVNQRLLIEELRPGSHVWANYEDGLPAIASWRLGEGSVTLFTGPLGDQWGTLPFSPTYLPLLTELTIESAPILERHPNALEIGETITLRTPPDTVRVAFSNPTGTWNDARELTMPGHYEVSVETQRASMRPVPGLDFVLRPPISESALVVTKAPTAKQQSDTAQTSGAFRSHPLQSWALGLFGLFFFAEGLARLRPWVRSWFGLAAQRLALRRQS